LRPVWTITDPCKPLLESFKFSLNHRGCIVCVGAKKGSCFQYRVTNISPCIETVVPIFSSFSLPAQKQQQFDRWKKAINFLDSQQHLTEEGFREAIDLTYDLSFKNKRKETKESIIAQHLEWLRTKQA
jgi:hypothetical protein